MKLIRFGPPGQERSGLLLGDGTRIDATGFGESWGERFFENDGLRRLSSWLEAHAAKAPRVEALKKITGSSGILAFVSRAWSA